MIVKVELWIWVECMREASPGETRWTGGKDVVETLWRDFDFRPIKDDKVTLTDGRWGRVSEIDHTPNGPLVSVRMYDEASLATDLQATTPEPPGHPALGDEA